MYIRKKIYICINKNKKTMVTTKTILYRAHCQTSRNRVLTLIHIGNYYRVRINDSSDSEEIFKTFPEALENYSKKFNSMGLKYDQSKESAFTTIPIRELKEGDRVHFYGEVFIINTTAKNYGNSNQTGLDVYVAKGTIEHKELRRGKIDSLLLDYDHFQGNELAKATIEKR